MIIFYIFYSNYKIDGFVYFHIFALSTAMINYLHVETVTNVVFNILSNNNKLKATMIISRTRK